MQKLTKHPIRVPFAVRKAQAATTYEVGDGGLIDNSGMMALLQRKAPKIEPWTFQPLGWSGVWWAED